MIRFNVITLFPNLFVEPLNILPFKKAIKEKLIEINLQNPRDFTTDKHKTVDDKPYGGGTGMLLMVEPIYKTLENIYGNMETAKANPKNKIIVLSPKGKKLTQELVQKLVEMETITLICGRYEGMDSRIEENLATDTLSIGEYVLSGGEVPALVIMEAITRLLPGVLEEEAAQNDSFTLGGLEYPQYTRPENFKGMLVPKVLLSGDHEKIAKWRKERIGNRS